MKYKLHQSVKGKITEIQEDGSLVVSFDGDLLRVQNHSKKKFYRGGQVSLIVIAINPLKFRLSQVSSSVGSFRISV